MSDRIAGLLLMLVALAYGFAAWSFRATFFTDPLGARFVPIAVAVFLLVSAAVLTARPKADIEWPHRNTWLVLTFGLIAFIAYAYLLDPLGFVLATTLVFAVFAKIFGASWLKGLVAGLLFAGTLYAVFSWGLGLFLPTGDIFRGFF